MTKRFKIVPKQATQKPKVCVACNGSGYYDNTGSPRCGSCNGTGLELNQWKIQKIGGTE